MIKKPSPIIALWILLTVAMVIFIGISFSKDISIGSYTLKKASYKEMLTAMEEVQEEDLFLEPEPDTLTVEKQKLIEPDTTVHNVLIFGDSMTHNLAMSLSKYGTKNNYKVTGVTWESSSIPAWVNSGKIREYIEMSHPDFVIVSLGSNEMELRHFDRRIPDVKKVVEQIGDIPYVWVGPPLWKEDKGVYAMLEKSLPKGTLFRAEGIEIERGPDHIHPTRRGADTWADTIMRWILTTSHPILAEKPDSGTTTKGHKLIYLHPGN